MANDAINDIHSWIYHQMKQFHHLRVCWIPVTVGTIEPIQQLAGDLLVFLRTI
jgi:hypothetical protein